MSLGTQEEPSSAATLAVGVSKSAPALVGFKVACPVLTAVAVELPNAARSSCQVMTARGGGGTHLCRPDAKQTQ